MNFLPSEIEEYALRYSEPEPEVLKRLNRETHLKILMPQMLSGPLQGAMLRFFSKMIRPASILEIGTFTGYSAICLSQGLQPGGRLHTIEANEEFRGIIERYIKEAALQDKITLHIGRPAVSVIPELKGEFDLVFIDADKENYSRYYDLVFPKVRPGGFILADNVLWSGKILNSPAKMDKDTRALYEYAEKVKGDSRVENLLLPLRDGILVSRKKG